MNTKLFLAAGSCLGFLAVALGAFGAHALKSRLTEDMLGVFEVGVKYQMYHALALLFLAWAISQFGSPFVTASGYFFILGTAIFSGSLYTLAFTSVRAWGAVTPIGGLLLLSGWLSLFVGVLVSKD